VAVKPAPRSSDQGRAPVDLDACRRGDRAALEALFRAEAPALERLLGRLVGRSADVEDLLQTTLVAAVEGLARFRGEASVSTWLARIAVYTAHAHLQRPDARRARVPLELVGSEPSDGGPSPEATAEARRAVAALEHHLDAIGARKRIAFVLHVVDGRPIAEVAALMGASETATKSRVFFARRALLARVAKDPALREALGAMGLAGEGSR
jgi:RNA polymerase sigma-70 factor (ECF subfamily)